LYPPFRALVEAALEQANRETRGKFVEFNHWGVFEGYRSLERQAWLYEEGRSRPGSKKTNMRRPKRHGYGLAADVVWYDASGRPHWDGSDALWQIWGHAVRSQKAFGQKCVWGGDWKSLRDLPHMETGLLAYVAWKLPARRWCSAQGLTTP